MTPWSRWNRVLRFGGNEFDFRSFRGRSWDGADQILTQKEAMILKLLTEREGEVVWRDDNPREGLGR